MLYNDNLCLFRCLALLYGRKKQNLEATAKALFRQYADATSTTKHNFRGVTFEDLDVVERIYRVNIDVYRLREVEKEDGQVETVAHLVRKSKCTHPRTLRVDQCENHFSYIHDFQKYANSFCCRECGKMWRQGWLLARHVRTCTATVKHRFPAGVYKTSPTVFELLDEEGVHVPEHLRYYPYRATYDFEAYFDENKKEMSGGKLEWQAAHIPLSVSVVSNVPGFTTPTCFVTKGDTKELVQSMVNHLHEIADYARSLVEEKFAPYVQEIKSEINNMKMKLSEEDPSNFPLSKLLRKLEAYTAEMPVIGFNSGKYDVNLVKSSLIEVLRSSMKFVVKRANNFMCLSTDKLKFLDIVNYLAPGYNYENYLRAYDCSSQKGFFPYEWVTSLEKLNYPQLPPHSAFYSKMKNENISTEEYSYCQRIWTKNEMKCFSDFIVWYNNLDVVPFLEALDKQFDFYRNLGVDMFKDGISVPGLTLKYLFSTLNNEQCFTLVGNKNRDLYYKMKRNVVGGPSIIFHRYHEKNITQIREYDYHEKAKTTQAIVGYDANALYLWALMQPMPTGWYSRRVAENDFKKQNVYKHGWMAAQWLNWEMKKTGRHIRHMFNGAEKRVGPKQLAVDGFCSETNTCYEFAGCYFHLHECIGRDRNDTSGKSRIQLRDAMGDKEKYIKDMGYNLKSIWECEWRREIEENPELMNFVKQTSPRATNLQSEERIMEAIKTDKLFGLIECDIEVPEELKEYFREFPPIFKNAEVSRSDIGPIMHKYAEDNNIMKKLRKMLLASYFAQKTLLATPLLKWYLEHGLRVTKIYEVIEYGKDACFEKFGHTVTDARRAGDVDKSKAIIANTMKLLGNSGYGKCITDKEKHLDVVYCNDDTVDEYINTHRFRKLTELKNDLYEVEMNKKCVVFDLPFHIGYFVYQYAKLRMLMFHYDFLDKYVSRADYQLCEMDTDSLYLALSVPRLEDAVIKEKRENFYAERNEWLMPESCQFHNAEYLATKLQGGDWNSDKDCCRKVQLYTMRTPGLFKEEWTGECFLGLSSKTYYCSGGTDKYSTKGFNKRQNEVTKQTFLDVLANKQSRGGVNRGFRLHNNQMCTYTQEKMALTYFYPKRIVLDDGVSTLPLHL